MTSMPSHARSAPRPAPGELAFYEPVEPVEPAPGAGEIPAGEPPQDPHATDAAGPASGSAPCDRDR